jgi:hypothetical protein
MTQSDGKSENESCDKCASILIDSTVLLPHVLLRLSAGLCVRQLLDATAGLLAPQVIS